ncbi:hypothetical protein AEA09_17350 [Lysinibacillus contaminans]|uniref:Translation initiation factor 2 n=1 Tax=Lysinibacillus contaminans TaxID=1293441 RepID=A0ABR5JWH9_9BACI|nr:hypothetical protein [Lysinibacillus contaminans]KOS66511.1 hypothetical protein AEA09_17350 [Lysinibacillus contaminans]
MKKNHSTETHEDSTLESTALTAAKVEVLASVLLTFGYSLSTLATILSLEEEEEAVQLENERSQDQNKQYKQMYKQLQHVNNRLDSIERKLNRN